MWVCGCVWRDLLISHLPLPRTSTRRWAARRSTFGISLSLCIRMASSCSTIHIRPPLPLHLPTPFSSPLSSPLPLSSFAPSPLSSQGTSIVWLSCTRLVGTGWRLDSLSCCTHSSFRSEQPPSPLSFHFTAPLPPSLPSLAHFSLPTSPLLPSLPSPLPLLSSPSPTPPLPLLSLPSPLPPLSSPSPLLSLPTPPLPPLSSPSPLLPSLPSPLPPPLLPSLPSPCSQWTSLMQKQEGPYPRQSSADRKEALYHDIIDYFDKGKVTAVYNVREEQGRRMEGEGGG